MRLIIASNRLPVTIQESGDKFRLKPSSGGVATGLSSVLNNLKNSSIWVGWPGKIDEGWDKEKIVAQLLACNLHPILLTEEEVQNYYNGFCNDTLWPLFHYFPSQVTYNDQWWESYNQVNEKFAEEILNISQPDDVLWINDFHLLLVPALLRNKRPNMKIGFFLHVPFPVFEIYRLLPAKWRNKILRGMFGSDLIGFHTYDYARYFTDCLQRILGYEQNMGIVELAGRAVKIDTYPIGIDYERFCNAHYTPSVKKEMAKLQKTFDSLKVILSIDRLDYTKGIDKRLNAYEYFLENNPEWREKVQLVLILVPSRTEVELYQRMKEEIDGLVGKINGIYGTVNWTPIIYQYTSLNSQQLSAFYNLSDIALITPLRDGMNLVAKEFVASQSEKGGVLILSETAGAAQELGEALVVNPNHSHEVAEAIREALNMSEEERKRRSAFMSERLRKYTIFNWAEDFLNDLTDFVAEQEKEKENKYLSPVLRSKLVKEFKEAKSKLLLLDYDRTLVPFHRFPQMAMPDEELKELLSDLSSKTHSDVVIISGRDRQTLDNWLSSLGVQMVAEHGAWIKKKKEWKLIRPLDDKWKSCILPIFERYASRLPGALIEEKEHSLSWHYRAANQQLAAIRVKELINNLTHLTANMDVHVVQGSKVVEVKNRNIDKGTATLHLLEKKNYDFILALGDDVTDEDIFNRLPSTSHTIKVGPASTAAKYLLNDHTDTRNFLRQLIN